MSVNLTDPIFHDEAKAREHMEASRWPDGPYCPHCGSFHVHRMGGKTQDGMFLCNDCRDKFTVRTGTVFERSHIPLHKWLLGFRLMASSKKGVSAHQLMRDLGLGSYRTAWFMAHRIREAMKDTDPVPLGGEGKTLEADETYFGNEAATRRIRRRDGTADGTERFKVVTLVERGGKARSTHAEFLTANAVRRIIVKNADRKSDLMTDKANLYREIGAEFASHQSVHHTDKEYVRGNVHTNTVEGFFSIFKRGMKGIYQHCGEQHLHRYLAEFDFRYSHRVKLGYNDADRAALALRGAEGKRLMYRQPHAEEAARRRADQAIPF